MKPSNLLLTPVGRVVLVDFGLATIADGAKLTRTGSVLGSMPYMAPEVLDGGEASVASDIYSLGVTLYELATLSLPFVSNRAEELRRQILAGELLRPRQRNRELSRDFETIILCALDRAPGRRYSSFAAFAADLRAALERRPIAARPLGPGTRLVRADSLARRRWADCLRFGAGCAPRTPGELEPRAQRSAVGRARRNRPSGSELCARH